MVCVCVCIYVCVYVFVKILNFFKKFAIFLKKSNNSNKIKKIKIFKKIKNRDFWYWDGQECHGGRFLFRPMKSVFSISRVPKSGFHSCGPKLDITNSKKSKKCETFAWHHFMSPRCGKKLNLEKSSLQESPFIEMTNHVRGSMTFRSNELRLSPIMA
jgi:hypothetical protein